MQDNLDDLNVQLENKEKEIEKTKEELEQAKESETEQYLAMKSRIKFMYSSKESTILDILFGSEGIKDLLNKAEYIEKVTEYDRDQLDKLMEAKLEVELANQTSSLKSDFCLSQCLSGNGRFFGTNAGKYDRIDNALHWCDVLK